MYPGYAGGLAAAGCVQGPGASSAAFLRLLCRVVWDPELLLRCFCMMWRRHLGS